MRVTTKGARAFFLLMLTVLAILGIYQCFTMANAFNLSPYTFKLRSKTTAADSLYIKGDTLYCNQMAVSLHAVMQAVAVQTDTVRGSSTIVGITDDTLIVDADSTGSAVTIRFGRWGGGLRWNRSTDAMQYSNDFSTWTAIGTGGSSTTNADSLDGVLAHVRPLTDGYYLRYDADGDSLYLSGVSGATDEDSTFVAHYSSRWRPLGDSAAQYIGDTGDSTVLRFIGASTTSNADDTVISFCKIYYGEGVVDSALVTYGTLEAAVAALGSGDITGVITSGDWLEGGASSGDVALNIRAEYEAAFNINGDTTTIDGDFIKLYDGIGASIVMGLGSVYWDAEAYYQYANTAISMGVGGGSSEFQIASQNNVYFGDTTDIRVPRAKIATWSMLYDSADYMIRGIGVGAAGTVFMGTGTSAAPAFYPLKTVIDTLSGIAIPVADSTNGGAIRSEVTKTVAHPWLYAYIDTSRARIPASDTAYAVLHSWLYGYIDTSTATIPRATLADSTSGGAARAEAAKLAYRLTAPQGSANTFGRMVGDSIDVDSIHAGRISVGTDASITDITGDGLAIAAGALTASLGTAITSGEITDGTIALADYGANSIDSTKIMPSSVLKSELAIESVDSTKIIASSVLSPEIADGAIALADYGANSIDSTKIMPSSIKASELTVNVVDSTHLTANSVLASEIATGAVATAEILDQTIVLADVDSSGHLAMNDARVNGRLFVDTINSGQGLILTSSVYLGTDITDDTLVVDYYPEYDGAVLADLIIPTWKDSIKIYGYIDTVAGMGNTMYFNDSVLTSGLHRRGVQLAIKHPLRVDSLRYIIVQGLVKDSSGTNSMYLKGMLRTSNFRAANVDSNAASTIKDYDSLGGDFTDVASVRQFVLSGGAITEGSPWYLLLIARHVSGTAWNWAQVGRVRAVYSRTRL